MGKVFNTPENIAVNVDLVHEAAKIFVVYSCENKYLRRLSGELAGRIAHTRKAKQSFF